MLALSEIGLERSPYNYDFILRQIVGLSLFGTTDYIIDLTSRLDIKGGMIKLRSFIKSLI